MKKFEIGNLYITRGIQDIIDSEPYFQVQILECLDRHIHNDWGDLCKEDKQENEYSLIHGGRLLSAYEKLGLQKTYKIYIITEWDRSATTILLPYEY